MVSHPKNITCTAKVTLDGVNGHLCTFPVDTGAAVSFLPKTFVKLLRPLPQMRLTSTKRRNYDGLLINSIINLMVEHNRKIVSVEINITSSTIYQCYHHIIQSYDTTNIRTEVMKVTYGVLQQQEIKQRLIPIPVQINTSDG